MVSLSSNRMTDRTNSSQGGEGMTFAVKAVAAPTGNSGNSVINEEFGSFNDVRLAAVNLHSGTTSR